MNELMTVLHISTIFACIFHHEIYLHFTFHREMYTYKYTYKRNQTTLDGILMICALSCSQFAQFVHLFSVNNMTTWKRVNKCSGNTGRAREAKIEGESEKKVPISLKMTLLSAFRNDKKGATDMKSSKWNEMNNNDGEPHKYCTQHSFAVRCSNFISIWMQTILIW